MTLWPKPLLLAWGNGPPARAGIDGWTDGRTARLPSRPHAARPPPVYIPSVAPRPASRPCPLPSGCFLGPAKPLPASGTSRLPPPALRTPFRAGNTLLHGRPLAPFVQVSVRSVTAPERPLLTVTACKTASPPTLSAPSSASVYFVALITPRHHNTCLRVWLLLYVSPARM